MIDIHETIVTDKDGKPIGVFLGMDDYRAILDELEEAEEILAYDAAKETPNEEIPFEQAIREIHDSRK